MRVHMWRRSTALFFYGVLLIGVPAWAQIGAGSVTGSVHDTSGGAIPGATVTLTSATKSVSEETITNASGDFVFPTVATDTYSVRVKMDGFKTLERSNVTVHPLDRVAVGALAIEVGTIEETVILTGAAPMIQTQNCQRA